MPHLQTRNLLSRLPQWSTFHTAIIAVVIVIIGTVFVLASRAGTYADAIISVSDVDGGFLNGLTATNSATGQPIGAIAANLPALAGCSDTQPKAFLDDLVLLPNSGLALASVRACAGGTVPDSQAIARFDTRSARFTGFLPGSGGASRMLYNASRDQLYSLSQSGTRLSVLKLGSSQLQKTFDLAAGEQIARWAVVDTGNLVVATSLGKIIVFDTVSLTRIDIGVIGAQFPRIDAAPDLIKGSPIGDRIFTLGTINNAWKLISVNVRGELEAFSLDAQPVSLVPNVAKDHLLIITGCPSGVGCVASPNRVYAFDITEKKFEMSNQKNYIPLQTSPTQIRFGDGGAKVYFDGIVSSASSIGQRFLFTTEADSTTPTIARIPLAGARWEVANLTIPERPVPTVSVPPSVPSGGGYGFGATGIGISPVPFDQIERLLGMPLSQIDWSKVTDEQIRAFGYDPATVRRYVAQFKLQESQGEAGSCIDASSLTAEKIADIEKKLGVRLESLDLATISDQQISSAGFDPAIVRPFVARYQQQNKNKSDSSDRCKNLFTQSAFVVPSGVDAAFVPGTVTNITAQTGFDLLKGGWLITLRWQAPGGAKKFHIYGRDEKTHPNEVKLATVDGLARNAQFGGFGRLALPIWHDEVYTVAIVPEQADGTLVVPTAIETRIRCYVVACFASPVKK